MPKSPEKACIFNIQSYSIHDGPGIRSTIFFKGCPLRCVWCQNPESQRFEAELLYNAERCTGCGACMPACPADAISMSAGKTVTNRGKCLNCGACAAACRHGARTVSGKEYTVEQAFAEIARDKLFYTASGGGVTASGGEALCFADFVCALFSKCREAGIHTALDTTGFAPWETLERVGAYTDLFLYDLKHMDDSMHRRLTGVSNKLILENAEKLIQAGKEVFLRVPVIPGLNDQRQNLEMMAEFICRQLGGKPRIALLPYHKLGESKLGRGRETLTVLPPDPAHMEELRSIFTSRGLSAQIGG